MIPVTKKAIARTIPNEIRRGKGFLNTFNQVFGGFVKSLLSSILLR